VNKPALLKPGRAAKCKAARTAPPPPTEGPAAKAAPSPAATKAAAKATAQSPPSEQTTPAAESTASAESTLGLDEVEVNSTNYKGQWMRLTRAARRPLDFPNIAQAFNGTAQDKRELLRKFLSAGENLQDLEAHFTAERSVEDQTEEVTEAMTVRQMREAGFSERLRAKIAAVTAKGGLPDADAPNDYESMRFWCTKKLVKTARDTSTVKASVTARVQGQAALSALCSSVSRSTVAVPDAQALLAQVGHSRGSANDPAPAPKPKAKAGARKNGSAPSSAKGLSLKLANGKTLEDKTLALRVALSCTLQFFLQSPVRVGAEIKKEVNSLNGLVMDCKDLPRFAEDVKQLQGLSQLPVGLEDDAGDGLGLCTCACVCLSAPRAGAGHACQEGAGCCDAS
ncbi:unnamed protein product, partial [Effrenium voratum]